MWAWRSQARAQAQIHQIDLTEVDWLLRGLCQVDSLALRLGTLAQVTQVPSRVLLAELEARWQKRLSDRVPIQHLVGEVAWRDLSLRVSPAVLIPRPETELVIDVVMDWLAQNPQATALSQGTWVDLGTGSGAIALGLAQALPKAKILAVDVSGAALAIAQQNAVDHGLSDRIQFLQGEWFEPLSKWHGQLAGIVSNPPYIPTAVVSTLEPEVAHHEPHLALDGGDDGLAAIRHLVITAPDYLVAGGLWLVEHMQGQSAAIRELLKATQQYREIQPVADLARCDRFVQAVRR
ncbi:peptide chain release factor N(5)-glutamine methyltransferase [Leptolyngbya iicbica LK]|uniref:Release factor glutamine methyltransferase n=2 Tax=Cyanophyceae TaxID=3028117 RepID=A0A4Q7E119_9CYAN|nr:peptide chain release factor N(5)-glutamine methyltransferase [Leptolyngbya sp. LK]